MLDVKTAPSHGDPFLLSLVEWMHKPISEESLILVAAFQRVDRELYVSLKD